MEASLGGVPEWFPLICNLGSFAVHYTQHLDTVGKSAQTLQCSS